MPMSCEYCRKPLRHKLKGRKRRFCSNRCRSAARRSRNFVSLGNTSSSATQNDQRNAAKSGTFDAENCDRAFPVNIVGGSYRWPRRLDSKVIAEIIRREVSGKPIRVGAGIEPAANDNLPTETKRAA